MKSFIASSRRRGVEDGESNEVATKIMFYIHNRRTLLSSFHYIQSRYKWYIGTYHIYKKVYEKKKQQYDKLSFLTDKLRKYYEKGTILYVTKEYTEDRVPHYHFLIGLPFDEWGIHQPLLKVRNMVLWHRQWRTKDDMFVFNFIEDNRGSLTSLYKYYGCKQRWFKYGIYQYLLYMFKYSDYDKYIDYYIQ